MFSTSKKGTTDKAVRGYIEFTNRANFFNTTVVWVFALAGMGLYCYEQGTGSWIQWVGFFVALYSIVELGRRQGHREGYFEGMMQRGYEKENNGLDDEMRAFKAEIETDNELYESIEQSRKARHDKASQ